MCPHMQVVFTSICFTTAAFWLPYTLGRIALSGLTSPNPGSGPQAIPSAENVVASVTKTLPSVATPEEAVLSAVHRLAQELEMHLVGPDWMDWLCLGLGYTVLAALAFLALWTVGSQPWSLPLLGGHIWQHFYRSPSSQALSWRLLWRGALRNGVAGRRATFRAAADDVWRTLGASLRRLAILTKACSELCSRAAASGGLQKHGRSTSRCWWCWGWS